MRKDWRSSTEVPQLRMRVIGVNTRRAVAAVATAVEAVEAVAVRVRAEVAVADGGGFSWVLPIRSNCELQP